MPLPVSVTASMTYWPGVTSSWVRAYSSSRWALASSIVSRPWPSIASRALIARFSSAFSIWPGSMKVFHSPPPKTVSISTPSPIARRRMSSIPWTKRVTLTTFGSSAWRRPNASSCAASRDPRATPASALATRVSARGLPAISLASNCRLPDTTCSRLLKSCATPPVNLPTVSIFCACASFASASRRVAISAMTRASRFSLSWRSCSSARSRCRIWRSSCSACSRNAASAARRWVMSVWTPTHSTISPASSSSGTARIAKVRHWSPERTRCSNTNVDLDATARSHAAIVGAPSSGWTASAQP